MQIYNVTKNVNQKILPANGENIVTIIDNAVGSDPNIISINTFVDNLKVYASIASLPPINLPVFSIEDSESEKLAKTLNIEFTSARKQLTILISNDGIDWNPIGSISLLNPSGYPYRMYNLLDFFTDGLGARLGNDFKIGLKIDDVGFGTLSGDDTLTVHGSYVQEHVINATTETTSEDLSLTIASQVDSTTDSVLLMEERLSRLSGTIWNNSTSNLYVDFDSVVSLTDFARIIEPNGYMVIPSKYIGDISGIWESINGKAMIREFL